jgi:hypothetical protein
MWDYSNNLSHHILMSLWLCLNGLTPRFTGAPKSMSHIAHTISDQPVTQSHKHTWVHCVHGPRLSVWLWYQLLVSMYHRQIFVWGTRKARRCKTNLRWTHNTVYTGSDSSESNNPTFSLALLICGFSLLIMIPSMEFGLLLSLSGKPPYRYVKFLTLL